MSDQEKVGVVVATWDGVKPDAYRSHIRLFTNMARRLSSDCLMFGIEDRSPIPHACNNKMQVCLDWGADWILYIDDDICPPGDAFDRLRSAADVVERPIVSALAFFRNPDYYPAVFKFDGWGDTPSVATPLPWFDYPRNQLTKVDATGFATVLIHRSVLEKMDKPWFSTPQKGTPDGVFMDRLARAGIPMHCHTGIICKHITCSGVDETTWDAYLAMKGKDKVWENAIRYFRLAGVEFPTEEEPFEIRRNDASGKTGRVAGEAVGSWPASVLAGPPAGCAVG